MMHKFFILVFTTMMVKSTDGSTGTYYTVTTTNNYRTDTSTAWYQLNSRSTNYPTQSSTYPFPRYSTYPTVTSTGWYPTRSSNTNYPTQSSTYPFPRYSTYPTVTSTGWYPTRSSNTNYPTQSSTSPFPWYSTYPTATSTGWYPTRSSNTNYPTQSSTYPFPWYSTYPTATSTGWYPTRSSSTNYPTQSSTYPFPWYSTYPTATSTGWYPTYSRSTGYPTLSSTQRRPDYTSYPTYTTASTPTTEDWYWTSTSSSRSSGSWSSSSIIVKPFTTMIIPVAKNVFLQGISTPTDDTVEFICDMNMIHYVSAYVTNMTLTITSTADCDIIIRAHEFQIIQIGMVTSLTTSDNLKGNELAIKTDGASRIILNNIVYNMVEVSLSSSSSVTLSGSAKRIIAIQLGRGTFDARSLSTDHATVFTNNLGLVRIRSNNYLSLTVEGSGDIIWCSPHGDITLKNGMYDTPPKIVYYCD